MIKTRASKTAAAATATTEVVVEDEDDEGGSDTSPNDLCRSHQSQGESALFRESEWERLCALCRKTEVLIKVADSLSTTLTLSVPLSVALST